MLVLKVNMIHKYNSQIRYYSQILIKLRCDGRVEIPNSSKFKLPEELQSDVISIAANGSAFAAVKKDPQTGKKRILAWGVSRLDCIVKEANVKEELKKANVESVENTNAVAAIIATKDGERSVVAWGAESCGGFLSEDKQRELFGVERIEANDRAFAAIVEKEDGRRYVVTWGDAECGGSLNEDKQRELIGVQSIQTNECAFAAIVERDDGERFVVTWGDEDDAEQLRNRIHL